MKTPRVNPYCYICNGRRSSRKRSFGPEYTLDRFICSRAGCRTVKVLLRGLVRPVLVALGGGAPASAARGRGTTGNINPPTYCEILTQEPEPLDTAPARATKKVRCSWNELDGTQLPAELSGTGIAELPGTSPCETDRRLYTPFRYPSSPGPPPVNYAVKPLGFDPWSRP
jgi:hypothetical protein